MAGRQGDVRPFERAGSGSWRCVDPLDVAAVALPPLVLVAVFLLPRGVRETLTLSYVEPTPATMYASHFVHLDPAHLATNLLIYVVVVSVAIALATLGGRRARFYAVFVAVLVAFPAALSALNVALSRPRVGYGFSGVNMAFLGTLPHAVDWYVRRRSSRGVPGHYSPVLFFAGTTVVSVWAVPLSPLSLVAAAGSLLAGALYLRTLLRSVPGPVLPAVDRAAREWPGFEFALAGVILTVLLPFAAFPPTPVSDGAVLNVFTHLLGFCFGYVVPFATFQVARAGPATA